MQPQTLYKYFSSSRNFFDYRMIRFSQRSVLNDPFELLPAKSAFIKEMSHSKDASSRKHLEDKYADTNLSDIDGFNDYGVLCLTEDRRNLTMWSHYAESHKGYVVGFDMTHPFFNFPEDKGWGEVETKVVHKVNYSDFRPQQTGNVTSWFLQKSNAWMSEKEHRVIRRLKEADKILDASKNLRALDEHSAIWPGMFKNPDYICLFEVPKEAVISVVFGAKMKPTIRETIEHSLSSLQGGSKPFLVETAKISEERFELELT